MRAAECYSRRIFELQDFYDERPVIRARQRNLLRWLAVVSIREHLHSPRFSARASVKQFLCSCTQALVVLLDARTLKRGEKSLYFRATAWITALTWLPLSCWHAISACFDLTRRTLYRCVCGVKCEEFDDVRRS